jgi:hypothetical protein
MLSSIAAAIYGVVGMACAIAAWVDSRRQPADRGPVIWMAIGLLFIVLAASRLLELEDHLRMALRSWLVANGEYGNRRAIQGPIAAVVLAGLGVWAMVGLMRFQPSFRASDRRAQLWARRAAVAMIVLVGLRLVSYHPVDALLYAPVHLNWAIDIGASMTVLLCAALAVAGVRAPSTRLAKARRHG